jgi:hypothetical protein
VASPVLVTEKLPGAVPAATVLTPGAAPAAMGARVLWGTHGTTPGSDDWSGVLLHVQPGPSAQDKTKRNRTEAWRMVRTHAMRSRTRA